MRHAQVLVWETESGIAELLRTRAALEEWSLREIRRREECLALLRPGANQGLVIKIGRDADAEFQLVEQVTRLFPETAVVVVGDSENQAWAELAWDLGASFVLMPPLARPLLLDVVSSLVDARPKGREEG
jgi:hypothetical protein